MYLSHPDDIQRAIAHLSTYPILWLDTETAQWWTSSPSISLIQALANPRDVTGENTYILDVLDQRTLVDLFIDQIMVNPNIEKVFHNASYDLKFLGGKQAENVTCTLQIARKIPLPVLGSTNRKLKTLAAEVCHFPNVDATEQASDWGQRPLSDRQLQYAKMDTVYVAHVHLHLLKLMHPPTEPPHQPPAVSPTVAVPPLSVTQVRLAFECPRLFYLNYHFGGMSIFLPDRQTNGIGNIFHTLSEQFVSLMLQNPAFQELFRPNPEQLDAATVIDTMQKLLYRLAFFPYLNQTIQTDPTKAQALHQIWQGLRGLIQHWASLLIKNRRVCSANEVLAKTFLAQEFPVQYEFTLPDGTPQLIRGRFDSLVYDFELHRLCVVDYKTYQSPDPSAQIAQVALYGYMLRKKIGVPINSAVYSVLPNWVELSLTWDQLEAAVHQLIPHKLQQIQQWIAWQPGQEQSPPKTAHTKLCDMCPQWAKCQQFFDKPIQLPAIVPDTPVTSPQHPDETLPVPSKSPNNVTSPTRSTTQPQSTEDSQAIALSLQNTLLAFGINVNIHGEVIAPAFIRVKLKPAPGVKVSSLLKLSDDLRVQLGLDTPPLIAPQAGYVSVDLPRSDRQSAYFDQYLQRQRIPPTEPMQIAIGVNLDGDLVQADLSDPNTCHFLVGGTTGSGKSEFLRSLLLSLLVRHDPMHLKIALVDPKRVTFPEFEQNPWLYAPIAKEGDRAIELMESLMEEMDRRYRLFEASRCNDLRSYHRMKTDAHAVLPRIVCIFDEYADFMADKETAKALESSIKRLGAMARAAGIHLIIATQRPEAKIVTPVIRSNLPGRVALRTASTADSMIVLGGKQTDAASLLGKGDLLYSAGSTLLRLQSLFAPSEQIHRVLHKV
jgi:S-DNA-T family DNA segregation ATPase FtsK/SpoIIIE